MRWGVAALLAAAVFVAGWLAWRLDRAVDADPEEPPAVAGAPPGSPLRRSAEPPDEGSGDLPGSLVGTVPDGALVIDASGHFLPSPDAIDLFDYYLSASGEESDARLRARLLAVIRARLDGENARAAERLLDDYLVYRERAAELLGGPLLGEDLERRLQYLRELRRDVFGADVAQALFGEQEARWFEDLERRRIATDPDLAPEEREQRLAALESELPEDARRARDAVQAHRLLRDAEERLRAEGAGAAEIARLREERFGPEAAARLEALDAQRAEWRARLERYRSEREALLVETRPDERAAAIEALRARHFSGGELVRVRALDRAAEASAGS